MALFKILKGIASDLGKQPKTEGYAWFTTDEHKLYVDLSSGDDGVRVPLNAECADKDGNGQVIADTYMTKVNPTGSGYVSIGRKADTTIGTNSIAIGSDAVATMECSIALGYQTEAKGDGATAIGGFSKASGDAAFAEGWETSASYRGSHAEGINTIAKGQGSHAEGQYTKASSASQHSQGKYNIEDTNSTYVDIIGNGTSDTARSNAATVDWDGNAWYAGNVYVGSTSGTNKDTGSKLLATIDYTFITTDDIDEICSASIISASEEVY